MSLIKQFFRFILKGGRWWLLPIIVVLVVVMLLLFLGQSSVISPFIYTIF